MAVQLSSKRVLISKANSSVVLAVSIAVFVIIFSLVAVKTLVSQGAYQGRVISAKRQAVSQLREDLNVVDKLKVSYASFLGTGQNVIGGNIDGKGMQDGDNAKITLDALPSFYDYPALAASLETLTTKEGAKISSMSGVDDEIVQSANRTSTTPEPIAMPFELVASGNYNQIQSVVKTYEKSIRPIHLSTLDITGTQDTLSLRITAASYYQPAKSLKINTKVVK